MKSDLRSRLAEASRRWLIGSQRGLSWRALLLGMALPLAYQPFGHYPLAFVLPALLLYLLEQVGSRRALILGWLFGVGLFGVGTSWLYVSIHIYGKVPLPLALLLMGLLVMSMALYPAIVAYLYRRLFAGVGWWARIGAFPALWTLFEWLRGWLFTGFPWLAVGYSQTDSLISGWAPLLGVYGVGLLVLIVAGCLFQAAISLDRRWLAGVLAILLAGLLLSSVEWGSRSGEPFRAALIQGNVAQDQKWEPDQIWPTMMAYRALTREFWRNDLVIWPESAIPLFYHQIDPTYLDDIAAEAAATQTDILIGMLHMDIDTGQYWNGIISLRDHEFYNKRHLVPFTEYLPLKSLLGELVDFMQFPMSDFQPGRSEQKLLQAAGYPLAAGICYEDAFGEELIEALPEAAYLVNVSNDGWFGDSMAPQQHLQMARMRAIETERYLLRATNTGVSAIVDAQGKIIAQAAQFETQVVTAQVEPRSGATPYVIWGNWAAVMLAAVTLMVALLLEYRLTGARPTSHRPSG